jgi:hypothetical protein
MLKIILSENFEKLWSENRFRYSNEFFTKILGCLINTRTYTLFRANKFTANKRYKFVGPEQCICAGIYETT